jgi:hypothetical protein
MEYKSVGQLAEIARVNPEAAPAPPPLSQVERLKRWAEILERDPGRRLGTFFETEYQTPMARDALRAPQSPVALAYADPVLRGDGLAGDRYGDAKRYFGISDHQMHHVLCYCHYGSTVSAGAAARAIRGVLKVYEAQGFFSHVRRFFG